MSKAWAVIMAVGAALAPATALAEGMSGYSRGNAMLYFSLIAAILIYGVHDVFHRKALTWAAAIAIPVALYLALPAK